MFQGGPGFVRQFAVGNVHHMVDLGDQRLSGLKGRVALLHPQDGIVFEVQYFSDRIFVELHTAVQILEPLD